MDHYLATVMMLENVLASVALVETSVTHVARDFFDIHTVEVSSSLRTLVPQSLKVLIISVCIHFFANFLYIQMEFCYRNCSDIL